MKRTVALLAVFCISIGIMSATDAFAQLEPPAPAADDSLKAGGSPAAPAAPAPAAAPAAKTMQAPAAEADTTRASNARARRARMNEGGIHFIVSLGLGSAISYKPDSFSNEFAPSFGGVLSLGARRYGITVASTFDYNFFMANGTTPNDLNILTIFVDVKYAPTQSSARPYLLVCGGYYRQWIVDTGYTEGVLGYGGGAGVELQLDRVRRLFIEGRYVQGQTRYDPKRKGKDWTTDAELNSNTTVLPFRVGMTWEFK